MKRKVTATLFLALCLLPSAALSQSNPADPSDVESEDAILKAVYETISGPAGEGRNWERFRSLFLPEAQLVSTFKRLGQEKVQYRAITPEEYITLSGPVLQQKGFFEREVHRVAEQYGPIAQVFSTYESRRNPADKPFARGINSFQLLNDGERWWILSIFWTSERPDLPIPEKFLP